MRNESKGAQRTRVADIFSAFIDYYVKVGLPNISSAFVDELEDRHIKEIQNASCEDFRKALKILIDKVGSSCFISLDSLARLGVTGVSAPLSVDPLIKDLEENV